VEQTDPCSHGALFAPPANRPSRRREPRPRRVQLLEARRERKEPSLGLGVKAPLRRFAALTPASLRLEGQCGSRWLPLFDERERLPPLRGAKWKRWLAPSSTR
jgi:hypothetical protein